MTNVRIVTPALLLALHAGLAWLGRAPGILTRRDDSRYLILARALRDGQYRDVMWPGAPYHHMYPPGYPLLLAAWGAAGGDRFGWIVLLQIALSVAALGLTFDAVRRTMGATVALCTLAILTVNPELLAWAGEIASEGPLAFCFAAAVWGMTALRPGRRQVAVVLGAALAAPFMRTAGVVLPVAVAVVWLLERRFRDALLVGVVSAVVVGPLVLWTMVDPTAVPGSSYVADLGVGAGRRAATAAVAPPSPWQLLARRVVANAVYYPSQGIPWNLPLPTIAGTGVDNVVGALLLVTGLVVGAVAHFRGFRLGVVTLVASAALLLVWPYQLARYATPLVPLIVPLFVGGLARLGSALGGRVAAVATALAVTLVVAGTGAARTGAHLNAVSRCELGRQQPDERCMSPDQVGFFRAVRYVSDSLPARARILAAKSEPLYLYTGRPTASTQLVVGLDSAAFWAAVRDMGVSHVLVSGPREDGLPGLGARLVERCADLELVRHFPPRTYLFRIVPPREAAPGVARADGALAAAAAPLGDGAGCAAVERYRQESAAAP